MQRSDACWAVLFRSTEQLFRGKDDLLGRNERSAGELPVNIAFTQMRTFVRILTLIFFAAASLRAQDVNGGGVVRVLIPVAYGPGEVVTGAQGTKWSGEIFVHNDTNRSFLTLQGGFCNTPEAPCIDTVPAGFFGSLIGVASNGNDGGALLSLPADVADRIYVSSRLLELTRNTQPTGVELPVVREGRFLRNPTELLAIPRSAGVRSTLRVYSIPPRRGDAVLVEILSDQGAVIGEKTLVPGNHPSVIDPPLSSQPTPGFAAIYDIEREFPALGAVPRFNIRLTPLTSGMSFWAFASVTHNDTQHVLILTPANR